MIDILVNIDVPEIEPATTFYTQAFGLTVGRRLGADAVELVGAGARIYLLAKSPGTAASAASPDLRNYDRHWTPVHLDFVVDDIDAALARAQAAGAIIERPVAVHPWGKIAMAADPFGNGLCIIEFVGRGYDEIAVGDNA